MVAAPEGERCVCVCVRVLREEGGMERWREGGRVRGHMGDRQGERGEREIEGGREGCREKREGAWGDVLEVDAEHKMAEAHVTSIQTNRTSIHNTTNTKTQKYKNSTARNAHTRSHVDPYYLPVTRLSFHRKMHTHTHTHKHIHTPHTHISLSLTHIQTHALTLTHTHRLSLTRTHTDAHT